MTMRCMAVATLALLIGCRSRLPEGLGYQGCEAAGEVTLDGRPLDSGMVTFVPEIPESAGGHPGIASIEGAGHYRLGNAESGRAKPLRPGEYIVIVVAMDVDKSHGKPAPKLAVPERYADATKTPLRVTLTPGENKVDLRLMR